MKKLMIVCVSVLLCSVVLHAQHVRGKRSHHEWESGCDSYRQGDDRKSCENERRREPCNRRDSTLQKSAIDKKLKEADFGLFDEIEPYDSAGKTGSGTPVYTSPDTSGTAPASGFGEFQAYPLENSSPTGGAAAGGSGNFPWILGALGTTIAAGLFMRFGATRKFRGAFIILSVVVFGFYLGGCPCPISGMQNVLLAGVGVERPWTSMLWFLGLIPVTYFFGKVWCGWVCHLGGLQEIIFRYGKLNLLKSERSATLLKWIRVVLLVALIGQVPITKSNLYRDIDPFKAAFNLYPANLVTWVLLGLLLLSSVFIYRPFCRSVCPVGLVLGWVSKIPGASLLQAGGTCGSCSLCREACLAGAIRKDDTVRIDNQDCLRCGQCLAVCRKNRLSIGTGRPVLAGKSASVVESAV